MLAFNYIPNHNELEVHHKDNNPTHNWVWNLEWVYPEYHKNITLENIDINGENNPQSKLTNDQVHQICKLLEEEKSIKEIINIMNFPDSYYYMIYKIKNKSRWKSISDNYNF